MRQRGREFVFWGEGSGAMGEGSEGIGEEKRGLDTPLSTPTTASLVSSFCFYSHRY